MVRIILGFEVRSLDVHGVDLRVAVLEGDSKSGAFADFDDDVNREVLRVEFETFFGRVNVNDGSLSVVIFDMNDLEIIRFSHRRGFDIDLYRLGGLDLFSVSIVECDIVSLVADDLFLNNACNSSDLRSSENDFFDLNRCTFGEGIGFGGDGNDRIVELDRFEGSGSFRNDLFRRSSFFSFFFRSGLAVIFFDDLGGFLDQGRLGRFFFLGGLFFGFFRFFGLFGFFSLFEFFAFFCFCGFGRLFAFLFLFSSFGGLFSRFAFFCLFYSFGLLEFFAFFSLFDCFGGLLGFFAFFCFENRLCDLFSLFAGGRSLDVFCDFRDDGLRLGNDDFLAGLDQIFRKYGISACPHDREHHHEDQDESKYASPASGSIHLSHTAFLSL